MMTMVFRVILVAVSLFTMVFMMRRIRQARVQIEAALFWVAMAMILVVFSVFPAVAAGNLLHPQFPVFVHDLPPDGKGIWNDLTAVPDGEPSEGAGTADRSGREGAGGIAAAPQGLSGGSGNRF